MEETKKTKGEELQEKLGYKCENSWKKLSKADNKEVFEFCDDYMNFLNKAKTEREFVQLAVSTAEKEGFKDIAKLDKLNTGDRVYFVNKNKNIFLAVIGKDKLENGINFVGSHIDAPRIDVKPIPLYEDTEMALLKTHYYGGIKKYQWTTIPLALHGVIMKKDGTSVKVNIGESDSDPVFCITDLLPHLAREQANKPLKDAITGENLNLLVGGLPYNDDKVKDKVKLAVLEILDNKYGITEEDFIRAELEIVPAFKARNVGFDSSFVGAYAQDDRVCAYTNFRAILDTKEVKRTAVCVLVDKEEIGSMGNTGMESRALELFVNKLIALTGQYEPTIIDTVFHNSKFLSADVTAGVDPTYPEVNDRLNSAYIGKGVSLCKYTGSGGKYGASDANAEFVNEVVTLFDKEGIDWQMTELGKVDVGGGGTIAYIVANLGMDVLDCGTALLSMHSPFEITSKVDVHTTYKAYKAFFNKLV